MPFAHASFSFVVFSRPFHIEVKTMEGASRQLTEWTVDEVSKRIREKFSEEVAKKFEDKFHICGKYILKWTEVVFIVDCQCY